MLAGRGRKETINKEVIQCPKVSSSMEGKKAKNSGAEQDRWAVVTEEGGIGLPDQVGHSG